MSAPFTSADIQRLLDIMEGLSKRWSDASYERDRARDVAVALEQENADLRERLEFATWGMA